MADLRNITAGTGFQNGATTTNDTGTWTYRGTTNAGTPGAFGGTLDYPEQATIQAEIDAGRAFAVWFEYTGSNRTDDEDALRRWFADGGTLAGEQNLFARDFSGATVDTTRIGSITTGNFRTYLWRGDAVPGFMYVAFVITQATIPTTVARSVTEGQWNTFVWGVTGSIHSGFRISDPSAGYTDFNFTLPVNITGATSIDDTLEVNEGVNLRDSLTVGSTLVLEGINEFDDSSLAQQFDLRIEPSSGFVYRRRVDPSSAGQFVDSFQIESNAVTGSRDVRLGYDTGGSFASTFTDIVPRYFDVIGDAPNNIAAPINTIGNTGQILHLEEVTGSDLVVRRRLNWRDLPTNELTVTEEGSTGIANVDNITFDNRHFTVVDSGSGDVEIVLTASAASGGASVQNTDGSIESPDPATIVVGSGLDLAVANVGSATETATISLTPVDRKPDLVTIERPESGTADLDINAVNIVTRANDNYFIPSTGFEDGDILIIKNRSGGTRGFRGSVEVDGLSRGRTADQLELEDGDSITLVATTNLDTDGWVISSRYRQSPVGAFTHMQTTAANSWVVRHNLGNSYPIVTVYDSSNQVVIPDNITITDGNRLVISFPGTITVAGAATIIG